MALRDRIDSVGQRIKAAAKARAVVFVRDSGWSNVTSGHGTSRDRRMQTQIKPVNATMSYGEIDDLYAGDDLAAKIVDKPAEDMVRKWISLSVTSDDGESDTDTSDAILQDLNRLDAMGMMRKALTWARAYGGALVFIGADEGGGDASDLSQPLDMGRVREIKYLEVYDRFEVDINSYYTAEDPEDLQDIEKLGRPKTYTINTAEAGTAALATIPIHETRFLRFDGPLTARRRRNRQNGWNDSVYTRISQLLADFGISWASASFLLSDFSQAVFKMKGLGEAVSTDQGDLVLARMEIMDMCRSTVRTVPIDADDEDYQRHQTPITGLPELLEIFMFRMSSAARIPATVLFGRSPAGMSATGESDLSIWYDQVGSMQETDLRPKLTHLIELVMSAAQGPTSGSIPESWEYAFNPLWQMSEKETAEAHKTQAETDQIYIENQVVTPDEIAKSRYGGEIYSYETHIDSEAREAAVAQDPEPPDVPPVDKPIDPFNGL